MHLVATLQQELIFADHVHPLAAGQDIFGDSLDGSMVPLHDVVQVFDLIFLKCLKK